MNTLTILAAEEGNSFWLPHDLNEVIWGTMAFLIVAFLLVKFGKKFVVEGLAKRSDDIASTLGEAASAREAAEAERERIKAALADSDTEATRILTEARQTAELLTVDIAARADTDVVNVRERATADLASTQVQAQADLAGELSRLALGATEKVVEGSLDPASQQRLIDDYINQVGTQN
jgi:F-type H+-transporting ATPase subunit b